jgi:nitroreductase
MPLQKILRPKVTTMLTTKEAIEQRCSIKKFKTDPIPEEYLIALLDVARLAHFDTNMRPWRFKIVKNRETKLELAEAAYGQSFIAEAPVVLVCCTDSELGTLGKMNAVEKQIMKIILEKKNKIKTTDKKLQDTEVHFSITIAIEHIVLRALDFGLGSCCVRVVNEQKIRGLFGWDERLSVAALLPIGYPAELPSPGSRLRLDDILLE